MTVNLDFWEGLPVDIQDELSAIIVEVSLWANARSAEINQDSLDKIRQSGSSEIIQLSDEDLAAWQTAMRPVWSKFEQDIGVDLIQAAQDASQP